MYFSFIKCYYFYFRAISDLNESQNKENIKKKNYQHKFNNNWIEQFPWLKKSNENRAFCTTCDIKIVGSLTRVKRHEQSNKHKDNYEMSKQCMKIDKFIKTDEMRIQENNIFSAELKLIMFLHEHNLPFLLMDHLPKLLRSVCAD